MALNPLRNIPSVGELLETPALRGLVNRVSHNVVVSTVRTVLAEFGSEVRSSASQGHVPSVTEVAERVARRIMAQESPIPLGVVNATGRLLPAEMDPVLLAEEAVDAVVAAARDYTSLELDLASGQPARPVRVIERLLADLIGAEGVTVAPSPAAAALLALTALAGTREVVVSRGQLYELDEGYRLPDVLAGSGAVVREVGTTNRTRPADYTAATGPATAALLWVEAGGAAATEGCATLADVAELGRRQRLPVLHLLAGGALLELGRFGVDEPLVSQSLPGGASLVIFRGDRWLGGPPCGIVAGRRELIERIERHPLAAALRADNLTLAPLAATLALYRDPEQALQAIPVLRLLSTAAENLKNRAERLGPQMAAAAAVASAEVVAGTTAEGLATWAIALAPEGMNVDQFAARLRRGVPAILGRVAGDRFILDLRSVMPRQDLLLVEAIENLSPEPVADT